MTLLCWRTRGTLAPRAVICDVRGTVAGTPGTSPVLTRLGAGPADRCLGDQVEGLVVVQHGQAGAVRDRGDQQVGNRGGAEVSSLREDVQYPHGSVLGHRRRVLD